MSRRSILARVTASVPVVLLVASVLFVAPHVAAAQDSARIAEVESVLARLVESYGPSGAEGPVRAAVQQLLPAGVRAETDTAGNLVVRVGKGDPAVVVIAHLDEIGYRVTEIRDDGSLALAPVGGFFPSLYEGRPALVHAPSGAVPGVFVPRTATATASAGPPTRQPSEVALDVGTDSRAATERLGVRVGQTVTMPKQYVRLAGTRATGRSFDDRVGCAALVLALRKIDPAKLRHEVMFVFSVREEIGLEGAEAIAASLGTKAARVYAIDTFVSADSPLEVTTFGLAPIGAGPVARALDQSSVTPPAYVDSLTVLARARGIPLQVGATNGGNDGSVFAPWGVPDVPIGWPLRYSHSPAEVIDLRDAGHLADLVQAIAEAW
ncbi:MAG TPA: M20/M25/M40 family metallo-hydrolase [Gemmatimonadales bacterium]|nr:M20/M25/M40 family metallo-hydrolase [Gemmatimonadales bacterium]